MVSDRPGFFAELKRRSVLRAAVLYVAAVWALAQGISQLSPSFDLPDSVTRWFVIICTIAFPLWIVFAWFYDVTAHGIKRESEDAPSESVVHATARKLDFAIIAVLVVAVTLLGWRLLVVSHSQAPAVARVAADKTTTFNPPPDSVAVLPFANLDGKASQQYFSDGITQELTNALGQNAALTVIAWDTASHYRNSKQSPAAIGRALNVANLLNGSIEREGDQVRVLAELVDTRTGAQIWSRHYDDSLTNIFAVQDRISAAISGALKVKFASLGAAPKVNPQAYDLVLKARALMDSAASAAPIEKARTLLERAVTLDPGYADAHANLAAAWYDLSVAAQGTLPLQDAMPKARAYANQALALDPRDMEALLVLASVDHAEGKTAGAKEGLERVLALDPGNANAHLDYGTMLPPKQYLAQEQAAVLLDPDNASAQDNLAIIELDLGEYAQALTHWKATLTLDPTSVDSVLGLAETYALLHRNADAVNAFNLAQPNTELGKVLIAAGRLTYQSRIDPRLHAGALAAVAALAGRSDLDPTSLGDVLQLKMALGQNAAALQRLPKLCAAAPLDCNDLSINPTWLPLRGDPRFQAIVKQYDTISKPLASASAAPATTAPASASASSP